MAGDFSPIDYRVYAPEVDGKTKNDHFREVPVRAVVDKRVQARTVLFDSWYAAATNLKLVQRLGRVFYTTLKANRLVSVSVEAGYVHLDALDWTPERLEQGVSVKLKAVPHIPQFGLTGKDDFSNVGARGWTRGRRRPGAWRRDMWWSISTIWESSPRSVGKLA